MLETIEYSLGEQQPPEGGVLAITDDLLWIRMPLPFALDHINLWLLRDHYAGRDGWAVIDTGIKHPQLMAQWESIFAEHLQGLPIVRVIITHMHPDHVGLAGWMCERWQVPLYMTMTDYAFTRLWLNTTNNDDAGGGPNGRAAADYFAQHGLTDTNTQQHIAKRASFFPNLVSPMPLSFHRLLGGESLRIGKHQWRIIVGYGHSLEHASLYCDELNILIAGDMVLPRISTNISVFAYEPEGNPLPQFLRSLEDYRDLPDDVLVLPSHGRPFYGLHVRIAQLQQHHQDRLAETYEACAEGLTAAELLPIMFKRELDIHQLSFAIGEAVAHLHALWFAGRVRREIDHEGCYRFYA